MTLLDEVYTYLIANSTATGCTAQNLFKSQMPPEPLVCAALHEYTSAPPVFTYGPNMLMERPNLQVLVRGSKSYTDGRNYIEDIYQFLASKADVMLGTVLYHVFDPVASPVEAFRDSNNNPVFSVNFNVVKAPS